MLVTKLLVINNPPIKEYRLNMSWCQLFWKKGIFYARADDICFENNIFEARDDDIYFENLYSLNKTLEQYQQYIFKRIFYINIKHAIFCIFAINRKYTQRKITN